MDLTTLNNWHHWSLISHQEELLQYSRGRKLLSGDFPVCALTVLIGQISVILLISQPQEQLCWNQASWSHSDSAGKEIVFPNCKNFNHSKKKHFQFT